MITVKVLGSGCSKCKILHSKVQDVVTKNALPAAVVKVEDIVEIM